MPRPRTPLSSYGRIATVEVEPGKWRARTRYRFESGRLKQVERFGVSEAKAKTALRAALVGIQESAVAEVKRETRIRDLGERYLIEKAGLAPRTVEDYTYMVRKIVIPRIGDLAVSEATAERLQRVLDDVAADRGPGQAKKVRAVLSGMMGVAARSDAVRSNPVRELARVEAKAKGATPIPLDHLPILLEKVRADEQLQQLDMVALIEFLAGTGARISEALGLDWADVDAACRIVTIRKSKTTAGERKIIVPAAVSASLARRERRDGPVFPTPLLKRRNKSNTLSQWKAARERLELGDYTTHSFRKTVATALDEAGLSARAIAEYLGHTNPSLTMNVYMSKTVGGAAAAGALDSVMTSASIVGTK